MDEISISTNKKESRQFITLLSHDLKNPLNNIIGFVNLVEALSVDPMNPDMIKYLGIIRQEAEHALNIVNALSAYCQDSTFEVSADVKRSVQEILENVKKTYEEFGLGILNNSRFC